MTLCENLSGAPDGTVPLILLILPSKNFASDEHIIASVKV